MTNKSLITLLILVILHLTALRAVAQDTTQVTKNPTPYIGDIYIYGTFSPLSISAKDVKYYNGQHVHTMGKVYSGQVLESDGTTILNIGGDYTNQDFIVIIKRRNRAKFGKPEIDLVGKFVSITGDATHYKHKPAIILSKNDSLDPLKGQ